MLVRHRSIKRGRLLCGVLAVFVALLLAGSALFQPGRELFKRESSCVFRKNSNLLRFDVVNLGLNNQIYDIAVGLAIACELCVRVAFHDVTLDFPSQSKGNLSEFVDIDSTNGRLFPCTEIVVDEIPLESAHCSDTDTYNPSCKVTHHANIWKLGGGWQHARREEFIKRIVLKSDTDSALLKPYYGIHLRLEHDAVFIYCSGLETYRKIFFGSNVSMQVSAVDGVASTYYATEHMMCKINAVLSAVGTRFLNSSLPIVIATGLGKGGVLDSRYQWALEHVVRSLEKSGFEIMLTQSLHRQRELNALADMKVMIDAEDFIGFAVSTFSLNVQLLRSGASYIVDWSPTCDCDSPWYQQATVAERQEVGLFGQADQ